MFRDRWLIALAAIAAAFVLVAADAHARVSGGFSAAAEGCAHSRRHPPRPLRLPVRRFSVRLRNPAAPRPSASLQSVLACSAGACSAGLLLAFSAQVFFGLLFGHGLFGGMAGFASIIGLLLQVVLVVIVARLIFAWWQRHNMPASANAAAHPATGHSFGGLSGMLGGASAPAGRRTSYHRQVGL